MSTTHYSSDARFKDYFLEDSYVLSIDETPSEVSFGLEVVLTPTHSLYRAPLPGEQHCYGRACLVFRDVEAIEWIERRDSRSIDANGEVDLGNIDDFEILPRDEYRLEGNWGAVCVVARQASIELR